MVDILEPQTLNSRIRSMPGCQLDIRDLRALLAPPPIDRDLLLDRCMDSVEFALQLLNQFALTSQSRLDVFDAALREQDHAGIAAAAHGLRGVAGILAATAVMDVCAELETSSEANNWNSTRELIQQLHHDVRRTIDFIPNIRK